MTFRNRIATYYLIEKPVRNRQRFKTKAFIPVIFMPFLVLVTTLTFFYETDGAEFRLGRFAELVETNYLSEEKHNQENEDPLVLFTVLDDNPINKLETKIVRQWYQKNQKIKTASGNTWIAKGE